MQTKKERVATNMTLLEGERFISEALQSGQKVDTVVGTASFWQKRTDLLRMCASAGVFTGLVDNVQLKILAKTDTPAGALAVVEKPKWHENVVWRQREDFPFLGMIGVGLQDPGNLGALLRTIAAAGASGCWLDESCADATSPKTIRASAGALYKCPVFEDKDPMRIISACQKKEVQTVATVPHRGRPYTAIDFSKPTMLVLGSEGSGLPDDVIEKCDQRATIPMPGQMESLNVAIAGAVLIYEGIRQRKLSQAKRRIVQ